MPQSRNLGLWHRARREAGIEDVRLHDLRHTVASQAVARGVPLPTVARMLGHTQPTMTLRYAHVGDREVEAAAERVGAIIVAAIFPAHPRANAACIPPQGGGLQLPRSHSQLDVHLADRSLP